MSHEKIFKLLGVISDQDITELSLTRSELELVRIRISKLRLELQNLNTNTSKVSDHMNLALEADHKRCQIFHSLKKSEDLERIIASNREKVSQSFGKVTAFEALCKKY